MHGSGQPWCVVLPVYNEAATLEAVVHGVRGAFDGPVLAVDDGSTDGSAALLGELGVLTRRLPANQGYGRALAEGLAFAVELSHRYAIVIDADGQHQPERIPEFIAALDDDVDVVSGSRFLPTSATIGPAPDERRRVNRLVTEIVNGATGWSLTDAFCGFKAYRLDAVRGLELRERGFAVSLEFWAKAWQGRLRLREIAIDRIYLDPTRNFGDPALADPDARLEHYLAVWHRYTGADPR
jgi:dolichol-phosphate mannosyltransferase